MICRAGNVRRPARRAGSIPQPLLIDEFTTPAASPLASPRTCDPGPGQLSIVDTGSRLSISGGLLTASAGQATGDPRVYYSFPDALLYPGRAVKLTVKGSRLSLGLISGSETEPENGIVFYSGVMYRKDVSSQKTLPGSFSSTTLYTFTFAQTGREVLVFAEGGAWASRTLVMVLTNATSYFNKISFGPFMGGLTGSLDKITAADYGGVWAKDFGPGQGAMWPAAGTVLTAPADVFIAVRRWYPVAGDVLEVQFRRTDDSNCWIVRCNQAGSTLKIIEKNGGVETERASIAATWNTNSSYSLNIAANGATIQVFTSAFAGYPPLSYASATFNQAAGAAKIAGVYTATKVESFSAYSLTDPTALVISPLQPRYILSVGDSKTDGAGDSTPPPASSNGYQPVLTALLNAASPYSWYEIPKRFAHSGYTTAQLKAAIDADIAAAKGSPHYILVNIGANDASGTMPTQAAYEANLAYVLDALHAKWPAAKVYVARVWVRSNPANCNTLAAWTSNVLAARAAWASAGIDERQVLPGSDNGNTNTVDGVHPNHAGYTAEAQAWKVVLGY